MTASPRGPASAFSLPMIMHRDVDSITAIVTSINAVLRNKFAMIVWLTLVVLLLLLGVVLHIELAYMAGVIEKWPIGAPGR